MSCLSMSIKFWTLKLSWLHSKLVGEWIFLWASRNLNPLAHMASAFFSVWSGLYVCTIMDICAQLCVCCFLFSLLILWPFSLFWGSEKSDLIDLCVVVTIWMGHVLYVNMCVVVTMWMGHVLCVNMCDVVSDWMIPVCCDNVNGAYVVC